MDAKWIRIRSWHAIRTWTRVPGRAITLCGLTAEGDSRLEFPADEKSCESCLRMLAKQ